MKETMKHIGRLKLISTVVYVVIFAAILNSTAFKKDKEEAPNQLAPPSPVTDIDGNTYQAIRIGNQVWMKENLRTTRFNNGDTIPEMSDDLSWQSSTSAARCSYMNDPANSSVYGHLYNGFVARDPRNVCPAGWHHPSNVEWTTLTDYLGGAPVAGGKLKETGTSHWLSPNTGASNSSGFTALPSGRRQSDGLFNSLGETGYWMPAPDTTNNIIWHRAVFYDNTEVWSVGYGDQFGFPIRCVKD